MTGATSCFSYNGSSVNSMATTQKREMHAGSEARMQGVKISIDLQSEMKKRRRKL